MLESFDHIATVFVHQFITVLTTTVHTIFLPLPVLPYHCIHHHLTGVLTICFFPVM